MGTGRIAPTQTVREAAQILLDTGLRSLPVVEADGCLVGMLTRTDLLQVVLTSPLMSPQASSPTQPLRLTGVLEQTSARQQSIATLVHPDVAIEEETPIADVIDALVSSPYKRVLVVDQQQQVRGIISDVDVLLHMQAHARTGWLTVLAGWARRGQPDRVPTSTLHTPSGKARVARDVMNPEVL